MFFFNKQDVQLIWQSGHVTTKDELEIGRPVDSRCE